MASDEKEVVKCPECYGKGGLEYEPGLVISECDHCKGKGVVTVDVNAANSEENP